MLRPLWKGCREAPATARGEDGLATQPGSPGRRVLFRCRARSSGGARRAARRRRLRPRRRREARRGAGARAVPSAGRRGAGVADPDQLRPVARHPLPPRSGALARAEAARSRCSSSTPASSTTAPCAMNVVDAKGVAAGPASRRATFDYGRNDFASHVPQDLGFAGFRVHYPIKTQGLLRRGDRLPRRQLLPRASAAIRSSGSRRAGSRSTPPRRRARSSRTSASSGW